jgi:hypothetical protein
MRVASIKAIPLRSLVQSGGGGRVKKLETASHGAAAQSNFRKHDAANFTTKLFPSQNLFPRPLRPEKTRLSSRNRNLSRHKCPTTLIHLSANTAACVRALAVRGRAKFESGKFNVTMSVTV